MVEAKELRLFILIFNLNDTIAVIEANGYFPDFFVEDSLNPNIPEQTAGGKY